MERGLGTLKSKVRVHGNGSRSTQKRGVRILQKGSYNGEKLVRQTGNKGKDGQKTRKWGSEYQEMGVRVVPGKRRKHGGWIRGR